MKGDDKKEMKKTKLVIETIIVAFVAGAIALLIFLLSFQSEDRYTNVREGGDMVGLTCKIESDENAFFVAESAIKKEHEVKLTYRDGIIDKMFYHFEGEYESNEAAKHDDGILHAKYNIYLGDHNKNNNKLTPVFMVSGNKYTINLFLNSYKDMDSVYAKLFYVNTASMDKIAKDSVEETKKLYEMNAFSCIISD